MQQFTIEEERKGSYLLYQEDCKDILFNFENMKLPFGIENYNNKRIVNLEFSNKDDNNYMYNLYSTLKGMENKISTDNYIENNLDLNGKEFVSCIRQNGKFDPLIRVNVTNDVNIVDDIKKQQVVSGCIRLKKIWIWNNKWGLWFDVINIFNSN